MSKFKIDLEGENKLFRVDEKGCAIVSSSSIDAIAARVLELKQVESHLAEVDSLCARAEQREKFLLQENKEMLQMLRIAAEDDYRKRTGFIHTIKESDVESFMENLRLRVRKEY
jgi:hypothetical protein